ncbi:MAG TPA: fluoride efflux transporter CrcB [Verrucomicrobiae bacterium]|nr:fluoride efflux transporter CrcB [Verrucomicrobiae bacterium]
MLNYILVAIGGALGSVARYWVSGVIADRLGSSFPWGTFLVNVTGCFAIGFFAALTAAGGRWSASPHTRVWFMTGVCGGYTTFSSFSLQTLNLAQEREWLYAGGNAVGSLVCCLAGVWLGHVAASAINPLKT